MASIENALYVGDAVLGSVGRAIPHSDNLNRLVRVLNSANGLNRAFMLLQYTAKLLIPVLTWRARVAGNGPSAAAISLARLAVKISDFRTLWRLGGLPPIIAWASAIERTPTKSMTIKTIERLQALAMLIFYPLEHASYLASHKIIRLPRTLPFSSNKAPLDVKVLISRLGIWSTRAWAVYVMLQLVRLRVEWKILRAQGRKAKKEASENLDAEAIHKQREEFSKKREAILGDAAINLAYLPLTVHWSLESGLYKNEILSGIFGMAAAVYSMKASWKAAA